MKQPHIRRISDGERMRVLSMFWANGDYCVVYAVSTKDPTIKEKHIISGEGMSATLI